MTAWPLRPWLSSFPPLEPEEDPFSLSVFLRFLHCEFYWEFERNRFAGPMYTGTLINDLFAAVERTESSVKTLGLVDSTCQPQYLPPSSDARRNLKAEEFAHTLGLSPADRDLSLLLIIHAQLIRPLEPRDHFADPVDIHQVGAMCPPKQVRI